MGMYRNGQMNGWIDEQTDKKNIVGQRDRNQMGRWA
jgi:hypothetical protein